MINIDTIHKYNNLLNDIRNNFNNEQYILVNDAYRILRAHPEDLKKYLFLKWSFFQFILNLINILIRFFIRLPHRILSFNKDFYCYFEKDIHFENIFFVHFTNLIEGNLRVNNRYYKNLPDIENTKNLIIIFNHTKFKSNYIFDHLKKENNNFILISNDFSLKTNLIYYKRIFKGLVLILSKIFSSKFNLIKVHLNAIILLLTESHYRNICLDVCLKKLPIELLSIKQLYFTLEGYTWEKIVSKYFNLKKKDITTGVNHSRLFQVHPSIFDKDIPLFLKPSQVFCFNKISFLLLSKIYSNTKLLYSKTNIDSILSHKLIDIKLPINILILPEAFYSENLIFINFLEKITLYKNLEYNFFIKLHPFVDKKKKIENRIKKLKSLINIKLIQENKNDFHFMIYRGTMAIKNYMNNGTIPLYLVSEFNEINIDFLKSFHGEDFNILNYEDLVNITNKFIYNHNFREKETKRTLKFYKDIF